MKVFYDCEMVEFFTPAALLGWVAMVFHRVSSPVGKCNGFSGLCASPSRVASVQRHSERVSVSPLWEGEIQIRKGACLIQRRNGRSYGRSILAEAGLEFLYDDYYFAGWTEQQVRVLETLLDGYTQRDVAVELRVSPARVHQIVLCARRRLRCAMAQAGL